MRRYKLDLLEEKKSIGVVEVGEDFEKTIFVLTKEMKVRYLNALSRLIVRLNKEGNFKVVWSKDKLTIQDSGKDFWLAFRQELITKLGIIISVDAASS